MTTREQGSAEGLGGQGAGGGGEVGRDTPARTCLTLGLED